MPATAGRFRTDQAGMLPIGFVSPKCAVRPRPSCRGASQRARARLLPSIVALRCVWKHEDEHRVAHSSRFQTANLVLATRWRPRLATFAALTPNRGVGGAPIRPMSCTHCSSMQRTSRKTPAEPAHYQKTEHYRAATRIDKNRTKCRLTCGSDRMLVVRSGSRAEVEKKGVRLSGGHKGSWGLSPFGLHFKLLRDPMVNPKVDHKGRS